MEDKQDIQEKLKDVSLDLKNEFYGFHGAPPTHVRVTDDGAQAWIYLSEKEDKSPYTKQEIYKLLEAEGVVAGYNESNIAAMVKKKVYGREIKVAETILPIEGKDGYYEYAFDPDEDAKMPEVREDGSVDYQSMSVLTNVKVGELLARYHHAVPGTPGKDIRGNEIPVNPVKDLPGLSGKGIVVSADDPDVYQASIEGKLENKGGKLSIVNVHQINGDVDLIIGKIEFFGDVVISGNVEAGVVIRVGKTLTIEGTVEAADIYAGGDIVLKRGIQGNQKGRVVTQGNLFADFIEYADVRAEGDILANSILTSNVRAGGSVTLTGKRASVIGGYVHGDMGVNCKALGNPNEIKTTVHAGCEPEILDKYRMLAKFKSEIKDKVQQIAPELADIAAMKKKNGVLTESLKVRRKALEGQREELIAQISEMKESEKNYQEIFQRCQDAVVRVEGNIYKGSIVCVGNGQMVLKNNTCYMEYRDVSGMIAGNVIVVN